MAEEQREHALLSASSAKKWLSCTPSARLEEQIPERLSPYAAEGTLAHRIGELKLRKLFNAPGMTDKEYKAAYNELKKDPQYTKEMEGHTDAYADYVQQIAYSYQQQPSVILEKRVDYSHVAPEGFGTPDCIILCGNECHVIDFKYGQGVPVKAEGNPQMGLYAIGAMAAYGAFYPIEKVSFHIVQPRIHNFSRWDTGAREIINWGYEVVKPAAKLAFRGEGDYKQGEWCDACFCRAAGVCRARAEENLSLESYVNPETGALPLGPLLSNEEVGRILGRAQNLAAWIKKLEAYARDEMLKGGRIPGWKLVEGRSNRAITDVTAAYKQLIQAGYKKSLLYNQTPVSLTEAERLITKEEYEAILKPFVVKPPGKPTLAEKSDPRPEMKLRDTPEEDFSGENPINKEVPPC